MLSFATVVLEIITHVEFYLPSLKELNIRYVSIPFSVKFLKGSPLSMEQAHFISLKKLLCECYT